VREGRPVSSVQFVGNPTQMTSLLYLLNAKIKFKLHWCKWVTALESTKQQEIR